MNTSLILLLIALWMLGHAASTPRKPVADPIGRRRSRRHVAAVANGNADRRQAGNALIPTATELLAKAERHARAGKPLEARLCRKAAMELDAIGGEQPSDAVPELPEPSVGPGAASHRKRSSAGA